jgi:acyl-CoA thioester hydrolase
MSKAAYQFKRRVQYYETDAMAYLHHSNYIRLFEEARLNWANEKRVHEDFWQDGEMTLVVLETAARHLKPAFYNDFLTIKMQARTQGAKIEVFYRVFKEEELIAEGMTLHATIDGNHRIRKLTKEFKELVAAGPWEEGWWRS